MNPSEFVANHLDTMLPCDYAEFLDHTGYLHLSNLGIEVYGYKQDFDISKTPCVIATTNLNKQLYNLKSSDLVISHTGFEELITILDCDTGKVFELGFNGLRKEIANSFNLWLRQLIKKNGLPIALSLNQIHSIRTQEH
jgi:hypothetical protein